MFYRIYNSESGDLLGEITATELGVLTSLLEEESAEDRDYYITTDTIDYLATNGADASLVALLRKAVGAEEGVEIRWARA
ncbi:MAG TPA: galactosyldiacylglycerol synthase [Chloroflexi bacterium]|nr:galactosyldiacylglycerol synthase [Chloroflexota bacterium]